MNGSDLGWAESALVAVLERAAATVDEVGPRFPLYADPAAGRWTTTARGSWTGGFWAGLLWLRARASGEAADAAAAHAATERLGVWTAEDTATRGMIFWYGTALAGVAADGLRERAARACLAAFDAGLGVVPWGSAFGGARLLARADAVPGLVPLLARAGEAGVVAARSHLMRHLELCLSEDPPRPTWAAVAGGGWRGCAEPAPGWSRTAAWLLLGVADGMAVPALRDTEGLRDAAERLVALRLAGTVPLVPRAGGANGPVDTSAAAIEAVAALKLAAVLADGEPAARGERILRHLCEHHLSVPDGHRPGGMLLDGCYDVRSGLAVRHELVWGDFFLALGLAVLTGLVDPFAA